MADAVRRLNNIRRQVEPDIEHASATLLRGACSADAPSTVDAQTMEVFIDDQREVKARFFKLFQQHPELLPPHTEGLRHTEHRKLVRETLKAILSAGFRPLQFFDKDIRKYIYMAELCAPLDLSLVSFYCRHHSCQAT
jgi:hypothetical protein